MKNEFKNLISTAKRYLEGKNNVSYVYAEAVKLNESIKERVVDPRIKDISEQWVGMTSKAYPEGIWSEADLPEKISEQELKDWIKQELKVFDPM